MLRNAQFMLLVVGSLSCGLLLVGCGGAEKPETGGAKVNGDHGHDHDHDHEHPENYAEAVALVEKLAGEIQAALAENDLEKADGPVHEIGHILEDVAELAVVANLSEESLNSVKAAVDSLMADFAAVDATIHGREGKTYADVAESVQAAIQALKAAIPAAAEETTEEPAAESPTEEPAAESESSDASE